MIMRRYRLAAGAVGAALVLGLIGPVQASAHDHDRDRPPQARLLGESRIPFGQQYEATTVGGLSGLSYDRRSRSYVAISDDRSAINPARFYTIKLPIGRDRVGPVTITDVTTLRQPDGTPYPPTGNGAVAPDPEGIAVDPRSSQIYWTSEGERVVTADAAPILSDPSVRTVRRDGTFIDQLPLPPQLHMNYADVGPRRNQVLEGLSITPDGTTAYTGVEDPLYQDGPIPSAKSGALTRITRYDVRSEQPVAQYAYPLDAAIPGSGATDTNGLTDLVALKDGRLLVLERANIYSPTAPQWRARIYLVDTTRATDVLTRDSLAQAPVRPVRKQLLVDFADIDGLVIDNLEGLTLGPRLPGGKRALVVVSDNNFNQAQITQFLVFATTGLD